LKVNLFKASRKSKKFCHLPPLGLGSNLKNKKMQLINLQGQVMVKMKLENSETTIATNSLPKGIYIIKIGDEYKKIVLE
jgi:hypothetical protein